MKKLFTLFFALCLFPFLHSNATVLFGSQANEHLAGTEELNFSTSSAIPSYLRFNAQSQIEFSLFDKWFRSAFKLNPDFSFALLSSETDKLGLTHYRYRQTYKGLTIEGTMYILHVKNNKIVSMNGFVFDKLNPPAGSKITEAVALKRALAYMNASSYRWESETYESLIKQQTGNPKATWFPKGELMYAPLNNDYKKADYQLCYRFDIYAEQPVKREYIFIDALNGKLVCTKNRIQDIDVPGVAHTKYSGIKPITTDSMGPGSFRLRETGRGLGIETYNILQSTNNSAAIDFTDTDNDWNNVNVDQDEVATDAHWGAEMTYDYYFVNYGRNSIDNNGQKLISYVHFDVNLVNANWDGTAMNYGDGDLSQGYTPLTCLDVTGHEITHGLTENTANLIYQDESGALNESFSDVFGNTIRQYGKQNATMNWFIGDEMGGTPFRDMSDPNQYGDPDTYQGNNWQNGGGDNGGVHTNSGVQNFWYYLLVEGGTGTNDNGDAYTVTGLGLDTAAAIAFRSLTVYLTNTSEYADARYYSIQAAIDLYGPCTPQVISVTNAWHAVGVGNAFVPGVTSNFNATATNYCLAPATVDFINSSNNAGYFTWDFGDGNFSTAVNPTHTYTSFGSYTVKLVADGATCGIDSLTKTSYISVDSLNPCLVILPATGQGQIQTACAGTLFDDGGPSANYSDNTNSTITIAPTSASFVTLTFTLFDFENNFDYVYIYNGPSTASPLIGQFTGAALPNGGVITSTSGAITIKQTSDQGVTNPGFAVNWQCTYPTTAPAVDFIADATSTCSGLINFTDLSTSGPVTWSWDFGDNGTSSLQNPSHTYVLNGTYAVKLVATNGIGTDSLIKTAYITVNLPVSPVATGTTICKGNPVTLTATASDSLIWYDAATGGNVLSSGSPYTTPALNTTTTFYVDNEIFPASQYNGPVDNTFGGGNNYTNNNYRNLIFDVYAPVKLISVKVISGIDGFRTIDLRDNTGTIIKSATVYVPAGTSRVYLNFDLVPGTQFELGLTGVSNFYRNNSGASFPYTLAGLLSITGTNAGNPGYYYFFYDWELQEPPCTSARTAVTVTVNGPVAAFSTGIANTVVTFTDQSVGALSWLWNFGDGDTSTQQNPVHDYTVINNFTASLAITDGTCTDTMFQTITTTGMPTVKINEGLSVYPNPFQSNLVIEILNPLLSTNYYLKISNITGQDVYSTSFVNRTTSDHLTLDLTSLACGMYSIEIVSEAAVYRKKIIRE